MLRQIRSWLLAFRHPKELTQALAIYRDEEVADNRTHLTAIGDWFLQAQKNAPDGEGYSRGFYLSRGWDKGYIETTGYIIPTMLALADFLGRDDYRDSAQRAFHWLLKIQRPDGAFADIDRGLPQAFDTGQVLIGLNDIIKRKTSDSAAAEQSARRACDWLVDNLDDDGAWRKVSFNFIPHAYYSRVSAALYETGVLLNEPRYLKAATRNIDWTLSQQLPNGFFNHLRFRPMQPAFLHTMMYVLEGLLDYHHLSKDERALAAVVKMAQPLLKENLSQSYLLSSQYDEDYRAVNRERCMTGIAQWAGVCLDLHRFTSDEKYLECARLNLFYLKAKQVKHDGALKGALPGSMPIWGAYGTFAFNNWPPKFFADALLKLESIRPAIPVTDEQKLWVSHCFQIGPSRIAKSLSATAWFYIDCLKRYVAQGHKVLDLGGGSGKLAAELSQQSGANITVVDPVGHLDSPQVRKGDASDFPIELGPFDVVYTLEVFQHLSHLEATLPRIRSSLKPGGHLIIGDRSLLSLKALLKPLQQLRGKWMYPWDSPFKERWRSSSELQAECEKHGFDKVAAFSYTPRSSRIPMMNRYKVLVFKKSEASL